MSTRGERHMGAVVGSERFKEEYVSKKVEKWVYDVEQLSNIAKDEPQAALSSFTTALPHRSTYVQKTVSYTGHLFQPLENVTSASGKECISYRNKDTFTTSEI